MITVKVKQTKKYPLYERVEKHLFGELEPYWKFFTPHCGYFEFSEPKLKQIKKVSK